MTDQEFIKRISLEGEEWRGVIGYEGEYMVSSYGRIYSIRRIVKEDSGYCIVKGGRLRIPQKNKDGYLKIQLTSNGKQKQYSVHRLVGMAFIPNPLNLPTIDHIDTIKTNNHVSNLRWCTRKENINNELTRKLFSERSHLNTLRGEKHRLSKPIVGISPDKKVKKYTCIHDTASDGFCTSSVARTCRGIYSQHKGYKWMYLSDYEKLVNTSKNSTSSIEDD